MLCHVQNVPPGFYVLLCPFLFGSLSLLRTSLFGVPLPLFARRFGLTFSPRLLLPLIIMPEFLPSSFGCLSFPLSAPSLRASFFRRYRPNAKCEDAKLVGPPIPPTVPGRSTHDP